MNQTAPEAAIQGEPQTKSQTYALPAADGGRFNTTQREPQLKQVLQQPEEVQQNTVSYLRPVKLDGKDAVPIQVQNWTQMDSARADLEDSQQWPGQ